MGKDKEEKLTVEFVEEPKRSTDKPIDDVVTGAMDKLVRFIDRDIDEVVDYLEINDIPVHFVTPGKRIDLHPAREYLLRLPRTMNEVIRLRKLMNDDDDDLDNFFNDNK